MAIALPWTWWGDGRPAPIQLRGRGAPASPEFSNLGADLLEVIRKTGGETRITVTRQSREDIGFREIFVEIDGEQVAILEHGQSVTCEVAPGPHRVRAHNTLFWKTHDFVLQPGEHARFRAINRAGWGTFGALIMLGAFPVYLTFERETSAET